VRPGLLLERHVKRAFFGALAGRAGGGRGIPDRSELARVRRVLLVRANFRLGNLVLATPALAAIRRALPDVEVDVLCGVPYADLFACDPAVRETIGVPRDLHRHPAALVALIRRLRARRYDLVLDAARGSSFLGAFFAWVSGGRLRVASATSRYRGLFNVHVASNRQSWHKIDVLLDLVRGLGLDVTGAALYVALGEADHRRAGEVWRELGLDAHAQVVGIVLGARGPKQWPLEQVVEIVRGLHECGRVRVLVFTGTENRERLDEVARAFNDTVAIAPLVPLRVFGALLARCSAAIMPDSGPMHLAAAIGTPMVALLRTYQSTYYLPRDAKHRVLHQARGVSTGAVLAAVHSILDGEPPNA
jgi:heptosyltransferase III